MRVNRDFDRFSRGMNFAVGVEGEGRFTFNAEVFSGEAVDDGAFANRTSEQAISEREGVEPIHAFEHGEIELTVIDASSRGNVAVVAILVRIGDRDNEGGGGETAIGMMDQRTRGLVISPHSHGRLQIGHESTTGQLVEPGTDLGVESESGDVEEGMTINRAAID